MALPPTILDATVTLTFGAAGRYYGYCTVADVNFEFANSDAFSTLTASVVGQEITYAGQEMQDQLAYVYQMPYVGTDSGVLLTLREINAKLATANIIDRYFQGSVPNQSSAAAEKRAWAESILLDLVHGAIHWEYPFADAIPAGQLPAYQSSAGATVTPNPSANDASATPIFTIGQSAYRRDVL